MRPPAHYIDNEDSRQDDLDRTELNYLDANEDSENEIPSKESSRQRSLWASIKRAITHIVLSQHGHRTPSWAWAVEKLRAYWWFFAWTIFGIVFGAIVVAYKRELFQALEEFGISLRGMGGFGLVLIFCLIFISAFPPMIGYGTFLTLSGFTFGFLKGFIIAYVGALSGAIV